MAHTDLILLRRCSVEVLFVDCLSCTSRCFGYFQNEERVFFRYLVLEVYGRALTERIFRINAVFLHLGVARKYVPELMMVNNIVLLTTTSWPVIRG